MRTGDATLNTMSPPGGAMGTRACGSTPEGQLQVEGSLDEPISGPISVG